MSEDSGSGLTRKGELWLASKLTKLTQPYNYTSKCCGQSKQAIIRLPYSWAFTVLQQLAVPFTVATGCKNMHSHPFVLQRVVLGEGYSWTQTNGLYYKWFTYAYTTAAISL